MASKLQKYYVMNNREDSEAPLIVSTFGNLIVAKIWFFKSELEWVQFCNTYKGWLYNIENYMIALTFHTTLTGRIQVDQTFNDHVLRVLKEMGEFYTVERLEHKPGFYRKFKM